MRGNHSTEFIAIGLFGVLVALSYRLDFPMFAALFAFLSIIVLLIALWLTWNGR